MNDRWFCLVQKEDGANCHGQHYGLLVDHQGIFLGAHCLVLEELEEEGIDLGH